MSLNNLFISNDSQYEETSKCIAQVDKNRRSTESCRLQQGGNGEFLFVSRSIGEISYKVALLNRV